LRISSALACQSSPLSSGTKKDSGVAATRQGRAFYLWIYPNFMINAYEGVMDTNLVLPLGVDKCAVVFDYYFATPARRLLTKNRASIKVSEKCRKKMRRFATRCSAGWLRARMWRGGCRCGAKRASICFTGCSMPTLFGALNRPAAAD